MTYAPPLPEMRFALTEVAGLPDALDHAGLGADGAELVGHVLAEAGRFAAEVLAPLNAPGDREGARCANGAVTAPAGFAEAYRRFVAGGWPSLQFDGEWGGQGLPWLVSTAVSELWNQANLSFALCPMLTQGAAELLAAHGSEAQKRAWLPRMVSGAWTGTMNLTEPQAGTDLGAIRTRAEPAGGGAWRITGQKIYITWGEHDMADNIVHMVLARTPGAPEGVRGISLFLVPKVLPAAGGGPGARNDVRVVSIEEKLGIHASPTCVMAYGDTGGATGWMVGEEGRGLDHMFTMMNNERLSVGLQGVAVAERAFQRARAFARERVQGRTDGARDAGRGPILRHPDVRRMLLVAKAEIEAMRGLAYWTAGALDTARRHPEEAARRRAQALVDFLTPVVKSWPTDLACDIASAGIQVHGGMGFIEETGAAQHWRDARITPIYEGTNGVQARDLVGRKVLRDGGEAAGALIAELRGFEAALAAAPDGPVAALRAPLREAVDALAQATAWLLQAAKAEPRAPFAASVPYQHLVGTVAGGWLTAKGALAAARTIAEGGEDPFLRTRIALAEVYAGHVLPRWRTLAAQVAASGTLLGLDDELI